MPPATRKVVFARVNRRQDRQLTLTERSFRDDMATLAQSHRTSYLERKERQDISPARLWYAADMAIEPDDDFLTGTLGYATPQQHIPFDAENWSWIKGTAAETDAAREDTIAPFAIDLRDHNRWVSFAPTARIQPSTFTMAFQRVLNNAVVASGLFPTDWEVDLVISPAEVYSWVEQHPEVYNLHRTVKFTNPGRDYDDDRREMRALAARRKTEEFRAPNNGVLNIHSEEFLGKLHGTETGDIELVLHSRRGRGPGAAVFTNKKTADWVSVLNFGGDLIAGTEVVLAALREYVSEKLRDRG
jgi:hypothetical protein